MKKRSFSLLLVLLLTAILSVPSFAEAGLPYVTDAAGLLTEEENLALESNSQYLAGQYGFGVYIITVDDITKYVVAEDMDSAAEALYVAYELGENEGRDGILLLLSMDTRSWALFAFGYGNTAFTDCGKEYLSGHFLDDFSENDWYTGLEDYQIVCGEMMDRALSGEPVDVGNVPVSTAARIGGVAICILLGLIIAFIVRWRLLAQLKSVAVRENADGFITKEGLLLSDQRDTYLHTTSSRVYSPRKKSGGGGGGGTTIRSSGGSSASGHF